MKKFTIAALAMMALVAVTPAQGYGSQMGQDDSSRMTTGPWMMRKSTGDATVDRLWFIMDRTLNAAEAETLRSMFRRMPGNTDYTLQKAIVNAIDKMKANHTDYDRSYSGDWMMNNGISDWDVWNAMQDGLSWTEHGALAMWESHATPSQMAAVSKLVRMGGYANARWDMAKMNSGM